MSVSVDVQMYEATPEMADYISGVVQRLVRESAAKDGKVNLTASMSLAITLAAQTFLACGGDINKGPEIAELIKIGVVHTLDAYKTMAKQNTAGPRRMQ